MGAFEDNLSHPAPARTAWRKVRRWARLGMHWAVRHTRPLGPGLLPERGSPAVDRHHVLAARQERGRRNLGAVDLQGPDLAVQDRDGAGIGMVGELNGGGVDGAGSFEVGIQVDQARRLEPGRRFNGVGAGRQPERLLGGCLLYTSPSPRD